MPCATHRDRPVLDWADSPPGKQVAPGTRSAWPTRPKACTARSGSGPTSGAVPPRQRPGAGRPGRRDVPVAPRRRPGVPVPSERETLWDDDRRPRGPAHGCGSGPAGRGARSGGLCVPEPADRPSVSWSITSSSAMRGRSSRTRPRINSRIASYPTSPESARIGISRRIRPHQSPRAGRASFRSGSSRSGS